MAKSPKESTLVLSALGSAWLFSTSRSLQNMCQCLGYASQTTPIPQSTQLHTWSDCPLVQRQIPAPSNKQPAKLQGKCVRTRTASRVSKTTYQPKRLQLSKVDCITLVLVPHQPACPTETRFYYKCKANAPSQKYIRFHPVRCFDCALPSSLESWKQIKARWGK